MRVLLTGSFGNIGTKVIDALLANGHEVVCFDLLNKTNRKAAKLYADKVRIIWGDITDIDQVHTAVNGVDAVIHNAAIIPPMSEHNPALSEKVNVGGTKNIIDAIAAHGNRAQLVFPSSISVHGNHTPDDTPVRRIDDPFNAEDHYAGQKIQCEKMLADSACAWTVVRIGACMDANTRMGGEIPEAMAMTFNVSIKCRVEYVHPKDVAKAMVNALGNEQALGKKFFLGGGAKCQAHWREFCSAGFMALGLGLLPEDAFADGGYYTEWMDTEESQRVLQFQQHTLVDYQSELNERYKWTRRLMSPVRPLVRNYLCGFSPIYQQRKASR